MKKFVSIFLILSLVSISCLNSFAQDKVIEQNYEENETFTLTNEQMREDYNYLWDILNKNYPWWGVIERAGINKTKLYNKYLKEIDNAKNGYEFLELIDNMAEEMNYSGHFGVLRSQRYFDMLDTYTSPYLKAWFDILDNDLSKKNYKIIKENYENNVNVKNNSNSDLVKTENVSTRIINENKIAYLKIRSFVGNKQEQERDKNKMLNFYKEVSNYENLIIDITGNGGGSDEYWMDYIVAPNIDEPITQNLMFLFAIGEYNERFYKIDEYTKPISKLPKNTNIKPEDIKYATHFSDSLQKIISPSEAKKLFKGKIWILVDENVYSSTESFSIFCKDTGFAEIVGRNTGGDGGGMTPALVSLPNSGLIVRYTFLEFINPDGTNSEEYGTTPDIISEKYETPLETCLKEIRKSN